MARYSHTYTPGGKRISTANEVITFVNSNFADSVQFLTFKTFTQECHIRLNDEDTVHWIDIDTEFIIDDINIEKITILDSGVEYYYTALSCYE